MRRCPVCERLNRDEDDFCECGEFLRWEGGVGVAAGSAGRGAASGGGPAPPDDERARPRTPAPPVPPDRPADRGDPAPREPVVVLLRRPDEDVLHARGAAGVAGRPVETSVAAGGRVALRALVRNQSGIVDNFDVRVEGLPDGWWSVVPGTVYLVPFGTTGAYEQEVDVQLHPPRSWEAQAGPWPLTVVVRSRATRRDVAAGDGVVEVEPFAEIDAAVRPKLRTGRRGARFVAAVHNRGNAPLRVVHAGADPEERCLFGFPGPDADVAPGELAERPVLVRPRRPRWIGRRLDHRLELLTWPERREDLTQRSHVTYSQRAWIPWWLPLLLLLLLLALLAFLLLRPKDVMVPDLTGARSPFAAQKELEDRGLRLAAEPRTARRPGARPGTVLDQSPSPGAEVDPGTPVTILIGAAANRRVKVPRLRGQTVADAEETLVEAGLVLGTVSPEPDPQGKIGQQLPKAGAERRAGTPVNVFLLPPAKAGGKGEGKGEGEGEDKGAGAGAGGAGAGGKVEVPPFEEETTSRAYAGALSKAGLRGVVRRRIDERPRGRVIGTAPEPGTEVDRGARVQVRVSAGFPRVAYDSGGNVVVTDGAHGRRRTGVADTPADESAPSWAPDGRRLAYRAGTALFMGVPGTDLAPVRLTPAGSSASFGEPAFAPTRQRSVLAFVRRASRDALCFAAVGDLSATRPSCRGVPGWQLGRIAWAPGGATILVAATARDDEGRFGLLRAEASEPFSISADDWQVGADLVTPASPGRGVFAGAYAPDGKRLAVAANLGGVARISLTEADDVELEDAKALRIPGCDLAWRPDGAALAVVQGDPACASAFGAIVSVDPAARRVRTLALRGRRPAWEPVDLR